MPVIKPKPRRKKAPWIIAAALVIVGIAAGSVWLVRHNDTARMNTALAQANRLGLEGQNEQAAKLVLAYADKSLLRANRANAYAQAACFYLDAKMYPDAISAFKRAEQQGARNATVWSGIAQAADRSGDHKTAIENYEKMVTYLKGQHNVYLAQDIEMYEARIARNRAAQ